MTGYAEASRRVAEAFVAAYRPYVVRKLDELGVDVATLGGAVEAGAMQLEATLTTWAELSAAEQRSSPLELFRRALEQPTARLAEVGAGSSPRDAGQEAALPDDTFELAPATSRDLDDDAWQAHVAWGIARAEAIAGLVPKPAPAEPVASVALIGTDLMDRTRISDAGKAAGYEVVVWRNPGAVATGLEERTPVVAFVDLAHRAANEAIRLLAGAGVRTVAFGPHVDDLAMAAAGALGAAEVLPRSRFFKRLPSLFPRVV